MTGVRQAGLSGLDEGGSEAWEDDGTGREVCQVLTLRQQGKGLDAGFGQRDVVRVEFDANAFATMFERHL